WPELPHGTRWAVDLLAAPDALLPALSRALDPVVVVDDRAPAGEVLEQIPDVRAVTADGDLIGPDWAVGGSAGGQSMLVIQATRDRASQELAVTTERIAGLEAALAGAEADSEQRRQDEARTLAALHHSDAR